jgi:hypothetical protein
MLGVKNYGGHLSFRRSKTEFGSPQDQCIGHTRISVYPFPPKDNYVNDQLASVISGTKVSETAVCINGPLWTQLRAATM